MKTIKTTVMALAVLAAMCGRAGESAEFRLDTMDGPRTARAVETIAYSTAWNNGDSVSVALDGVAVKEVACQGMDFPNPVISGSTENIPLAIRIR